MESFDRRLHSHITASSMENLFPTEITTDIISRLPVESVLDCRRVCKTWRTLTYHPSFADLHLCHNSLQLDDDDSDDDDDDDDDQKYQNKSSASSASASGSASASASASAAASASASAAASAYAYGSAAASAYAYGSAAASSKVGFVSLIELEDKRYQLYYGEYDENDEEGKTYKTLKKINHPPLSDTSVMVGSCNGLICLSVNHHGVQDPVYIFNPITRECVNLPRFEDKCPKGGSLEGRIVFGFGYDPRANEYKVIRIYYSASQPSIGRVQVYTLGSSKGWRNKGEIQYTSRLFSLPPHGILANGALHWLAFGDGKIVSFDLADEEFHLLPLPPCLCSGDFYQLQVLGGSLCAFNQDEDGCVNIWTLKKKRKSCSYEMMKKQDYQPWNWSWAFTIDGEDICDTNFMDEYEPFALTKSGELLLWYCGGFLTRCTLKTSILEKLVGYVPQWEFFEATLHMNSFVSLKALGEDVKIIGSAEGVIEQEKEN